MIIYNSRSHIHKIIATTAPKLAKLIAGGGEGNAGVWKMLPQIQQSFIEEYCKQGGIDKVLVEYELGHHDPDYRCNACDTGNQQLCLLSKLKVDSNSCIIIHPVEEKMYSREDMISFAKFSKKHGFGLNCINDNMFNKWSKENL